MSEKPYRPDLEPGFWPEWQETTPMARAIQFPLHDPHWQSRVINAHVRRTRRPATPKPEDQSHE